MKKQFLQITLAILLLAIAGGVLIHGLSSSHPAPVQEDAVSRLPPPGSASVQPPLSRPADQGPRPGPQPAQMDPLGQNLFPPELVERFQARIGLSAEQGQAIMADLQKVQPKLEKLQQQLQQEVAALGALLNQKRVELEPALAQSEKVHELEGQIRRTQLALLIGLKNRLSPEQQARLQEIKTQQARAGAFDGNPPQAIQRKMQKLQSGLQRRQKDGWDPSPVAKAMQQFEPLMRAGQLKEAEAVLDEALALLEEKTPK